MTRVGSQRYSKKKKTSNIRAPYTCYTHNPDDKLNRKFCERDESEASEGA